MKIVVFTYDRFSTITTPLALDSAGVTNYHVLCHTEQQLASFVKGGRVREETIIATGEPRGLSNNRNWALDNLCAENEWVLFLVDDWLGASCFKDYWSTKCEDLTPFAGSKIGDYNKHFKLGLGFREFLKCAEETAIVADKAAVRLCGFAQYSNPSFRLDKWRFNALTDGRALLVKAGALRFDTNVQLLDDRAWCAQHLEQGLSTLVNNWVLPSCSRFTKGGFGSAQERGGQQAREAQYLLWRFAGGVVAREKAGFASGSHVVLATKAQNDWKAWAEAQSARRRLMGWETVNAGNWRKLRGNTV